MLSQYIIIKLKTIYSIRYDYQQKTSQLHIYYISILVLLFRCLYHISAYTDDGGFAVFFVSFIIFTSTCCWIVIILFVIILLWNPTRIPCWSPNKIFNDIKQWCHTISLPIRILECLHQ
jgi:hypothetical protein